MKINTKLVLTLLGVGLLPLTITSLLSYSIAAQSLTQSMLNHLEAVAVIQENRIESIIVQNLEQLALIANRTQLRQDLANFIHNPQPELQKELSRKLRDSQTSISSIKTISILTLDGKIVASTDTAKIGTNHVNEEFFIKGRKEDTVDTFFLDPHQHLNVYLSAPIILEKQLLGVLVIEADADNIIATVHDYSGLGKTGETVLAKRDKTGEALFITPLRFDPQATLHRTLPKENLALPINVALSKQETLMTNAVDYRGQPTLAATRYIDMGHVDWGLVVKIDTVEAFAPVVQLRHLLITIILISSTTIIFVSWPIAQSITKPIINLTHTAERISAGDLSCQVEITSTNEIGILARAFEQMTKKLIEANTDLEHKVQSRTLELKQANTLLEEEVAERRRAEAELRRYHDHLEELVTERTTELMKINSQLQQEISGREQVQEALQQRNRELALLNRANQAFISTLDLDQVLSTTLEEVRHLLGVVDCSAWLVDPKTNELICWEVISQQTKIPRNWRLAPGQGLVGWVASHGQSLIVPDTRTDERHFKGIDEQTGLELRSILTVPLQLHYEVIGVLQVVDTIVDRFTDTDLTLLESLAATAAVAIENARLYKQARQDAATKSALLQEVNHRVKNNLAAIIGALYAEQRHAGLENQPVYQAIMKDLINRVQGLATVHNLLAATEWSPVLLNELTTQVICSTLRTIPPDKRIALNVSTSPIRVVPDYASNLAILINELTTNTIKHALLERQTAQITVYINHNNDLISLEFRDDGPGYPDEILQHNPQCHHVGFDLIQNIVRGNLRGELALHNDQGAVTTIQFKIKV